MLLIVNAAIAQNGSLQKNETSKLTIENIFVHVSNTTLIAGETLHCKLYCLNSPNNNFSSISKIAHVELVNKENQSILTAKINLENGTGEGDFFIPATIATGSYKLIAYTKWMLNNSDSKVSSTDLILINPYTTNSDKINNSKDVTNNFEAKSNSGSYALEVNKKFFAKREQVSISLKSVNSMNTKGNFSLSVKKKDNLPSQKQMNSNEFAAYNSGLQTTLKEQLSFLPELRGEIISGTITNNKDPKQVAGKNVALSLPGDNFAFKIAKTNSEGKFNFILDKSPNYSNAVIQVTGEDKNDYTVEIDKANVYNLKNTTSSEELSLSFDYKAGIEERSVASQIENAYYTSKKDSLQPDVKTVPFYNPLLEREYILEDYTKFPSLKETITEVVKEAYYREENKNFTLHVRDINYDLKFFAEPALILVDGLMIQNSNELVDYKMENVYKISLVPGVYVYGPKAFDGIISFTTKNGDYITKEKGSHILKTEIQRPLNKTICFKPDYTNTNKYDRIPDYRHQLLWEPELSLEGLEKTISFFTSDVPGIYEINLEGFTNNGTPVSLKESFEVK
ncbi:hypothetical protein [Flavobacterium gelatinilyticum]|uniref:hypothetical protein n=1 Tax=Flavobacterium gelatinilyticum TaxID=3003260 RepID=UPI002480C430|nr:hypothetical protein [Flavobacterium gelatinilyticum]